jgi:chromosome segregation ATPase
VNILEKRIENQVQFWSLLGPFAILLAIAVLLFKMSSHWYLPLSALVGIPLCVAWRMKGLAAALTFLATLAVFAYPNLEFNELYWHMGMAMAMALSFVILTLSLEEVQGLVGKLQAESQSRLDNFLRLDGNVRVLEQDWVQEKEQLSAQVQTLTQTLTQAQEERQTFQKLVFLAKDELVALRGQHEELMQDLFYKKQQITQLNERIEENEVTIQAFVNTDSEQRVQQLIDALSEKEQQVNTQQAKLFEAQEQLEPLLNESEFLKQSLEEARSLADEYKVTSKTLQEQLQQLFHQKETIQQALLHVQTREGEQLRLQEEAYQADMMALRSHAHSLSVALEQSKQELEAMRNDSSRLSEEQQQELLNQVQENLHSKAEIEQVLQAKEREIIGLQEQCQRQQIRLDQLQMQADARFKRAEEAVAELDQTKRELSALQDSQAQTRHALDQKQSDIEALEKEKANLEHLNLDIMTQAQMAQEATAELEMTKHALAALQDTLAQTQQNLAHKQSRIETLEQEKAELEELNQDVLTQIEIANKAIAEQTQQEYEALQKTLVQTQQSVEEKQSYIEALEMEKSQLEKLKFEVIAQESIAEQTQQEIVALQDTLTKVQQSLNEKQDFIDILEKEKFELEKSSFEVVSKAQMAQEAVATQAQQELAALQETLTHAQQNLDQNQRQLQALEQEKAELERFKDKLSELQEHHAQAQRELEQNQERVQVLEQEQAQLQSELQKMQLELSKKPAKGEQKTERKLKNSLDAHRIEALYLQLKEQFEQKGEVLGATRKELFHTQEKLAALQREIAEEAYIPPQSNELLLQKDLNALSNELEELRQQNQQDVEALHSLIADLLKQVPRK